MGVKIVYSQDWLNYARFVAATGLCVAKSSNVFSTIPIAGTIAKNHRKYSAVLICPNRMNGSST